MPLIWRSMKAEKDMPQIGRGGALLGVRVGPEQRDDINPDENGIVYLGKGGMSVAPSVDALPPHRLPRRLRDSMPDRFPAACGSNALCCWSMGKGEFKEELVTERLNLRLDPDRPNKHGFVEPHDKMAIEDYEASLSATRESWQLWTEVKQ